GLTRVHRKLRQRDVHAEHDLADGHSGIAVAVSDARHTPRDASGAFTRIDEAETRVRSERRARRVRIRAARATEDPLPDPKSLAALVVVRAQLDDGCTRRDLIARANLL